MVTKTRAVNLLTPYGTNGGVSDTRYIKASVETMVDSSTTGSARTDNDAVDSFLLREDKSGWHNFHGALQESAKSAGDVGLATFRVDRTERTWTPAHVTLTGNTGVVTRVTGYTLEEPDVSEFPAITPFSHPNEAARKVKGQELYARALPNRAQADLGVTLAEILTNPVRAAVIPGGALLKRPAQYRTAHREAKLASINRSSTAAATQRLQQIKGLPLADARAAADDYLAYVFGARPTVQTLDDLAESITRSRSQAETMVRSSDRRLRRREGLLTDRRVASRFAVRNHYMFPQWNTYMLANAQSHYFHESSIDQWWSGSFRLTARDAESWLDRSTEFFLRIDQLTGLGVDLRTAWDLIPFSFIVDWFANTGSFLENRQIIADYNIACEYGYVMTHTQTTRKLTARGTFSSAANYPEARDYLGYAPAGISFQYLTEVKQRDRCSSYGFNTVWDNLSDQQWGALTALGLSNVPGGKPRIRT